MIRQAFAIIIFAKLGAEFRLPGDDCIQLTQIVVTTGAQIICDPFGFGHFRPDQPEGVNEWQMHRVLPLLAEIPEAKRAGIFIAKPDGLIADEKFREPRSDRTNCWD